MRVIINDKENNHLKEIAGLFENSESIFIAVAFLKMSGLKLIKKQIETALKKKTKIVIVCSLDFNITEPSALKKLNELTNIYPFFNLFIFNSKGNISFHPKIYTFNQKNESIIMIGSANFTNGGLISNFELSLKNTIKNTSQEFFKLENLKNSIITKSTKLNDINLSQYTRKHQIYNRNLKDALDISKREENALGKLDLLLVEKYLVDYLSNDDEQSNFKLRKVNYNKAKSILETIRLEDIDDKTFFNYYETLVGRKKVKSLWHSSNIARHKNAIKKHRIEFKSLLNEVVNIGSKSPSNIFDLFRKYYKKGNPEKINGLGPNILTEIFNTYYPEKYAVLNDNPLTCIKFFGYEEFPPAQTFTPNNYQDFNILITALMKTYNFETLGQADHFLNYIYQLIKKEIKKKEAENY